MDFRLTPEEERFRDEVREFFKSENELAEKVREEMESGQGFGPATWEIFKKVGAKGWLCPTWPKKYGGSEKSIFEQLAFNEAMAYWRAPGYDRFGVSMLGPTLLAAGSEEQKQRFLPPICRGDVVVFLSSDNEHRKVVHRVIGIRGKTVVTRGDNNRSIDRLPPESSRILGRVFYLRRIERFLKVRRGFVGLIYAFLVRLLRRIDSLISSSSLPMLFWLPVSINLLFQNPVQWQIVRPPHPKALHAGFFPLLFLQPKLNV